MSCIQLISTYFNKFYERELKRIENNFTKPNPNQISSKTNQLSLHTSSLSELNAKILFIVLISPETFFLSKDPTERMNTLNKWVSEDLFFLSSSTEKDIVKSENENETEEIRGKRSYYCVFSHSPYRWLGITSPKENRSLTLTTNFANFRVECDEIQKYCNLLISGNPNAIYNLFCWQENQINDVENHNSKYLWMYFSKEWMEIQQKRNLFISSLFVEKSLGIARGYLWHFEKSNQKKISKIQKKKSGQTQKGNKKKKENTIQNELIKEEESVNELNNSNQNFQSNKSYVIPKSLSHLFPPKYQIFLSLFVSYNLLRFSQLPSLFIYNDSIHLTTSLGDIESNDYYQQFKQEINKQKEYLISLLNNTLLLPEQLSLLSSYLNLSDSLLSAAFNSKTTSNSFLELSPSSFSLSSKFSQPDFSISQNLDQWLINFRFSNLSEQ